MRYVPQQLATLDLQLRALVRYYFRKKLPLKFKNLLVQCVVIEAVKLPTTDR